MIKQEYKYSLLTWEIIICAMKAQKLPGKDFQEVYYQSALELEFKLLEIPYQREFNKPLFYPKKHNGTGITDFLVREKISVKLIPQFVHKVPFFF